MQTPSEKTEIQYHKVLAEYPEKFCNLVIIVLHDNTLLYDLDVPFSLKRVSGVIVKNIN